MYLDGGMQVKLGKVDLSVNNEGLAGYVFILPWLFGFLVFTIFPMAMSLFLAFTRYDMLSAPIWVGLENFETMLQYDYQFRTALRVTFTYALTSVPLRLLFALFLAVLFVQPRRGVGVYRAIFYIPSVIGGSVAVAVMWRQLFGVNGALNSFLMASGLVERPTGWITHPDTALWTLIILAVWQFGSPMLIFLAGLKQIPLSLYEAAEIDGANGIQRFMRVTIPMLTPIIFFNFIMQTVSGFMMFTQALIITDGGPFDQTLLYVLYLFRKGFVDYSMGYASALAWVLLVIIAVITAIIFKSSGSWVFYEAKGDL